MSTAAPPSGTHRLRLISHGAHLGPVSSLSESVSMSAYSFACTSTTKRALASSCSTRAFLCSAAIWASRGSDAAASAAGPGQPAPRQLTKTVLERALNQEMISKQPHRQSDGGARRFLVKEECSGRQQPSSHRPRRARIR